MAACDKCLHYDVCVKWKKPALYGVTIDTGCKTHFKSKDILETVYAKWELDKSFMPFISTCSKCGASYTIDGAFLWRFCPSCGACMEEA